ncbi:PIN domain-like protein [Backusella circina FSU 941]|nr:PIN domain-like protein [Backusella circina FSU 941]
MGIAGLLPFLESAKRDVNLEDLAGKRVAVDGHCWLHAAVGVMKDDLLEGTTEPVYLNYIKFRLFQLLKHKIIPIIVFDGQSVPIKSDISEDRKKKREIAKEKAEQFKKENKLVEARKQLERTLKVTEDMIHHTIKLLDQYRVKHIIAPFEADPQLAYLSLTNQVEAIFSVDSDLLVFGCKQVIFPKRGAQGKGFYSIKQEDVFKVKEQPEDDLEEISSRKVYVDLTNYDTVKLRHVCILSGCDYLKSLPKVGLKTAFASLQKSDHDIDKTIKGLCHSRKYDVDVYMTGFRNANAGFLHQHVFDPRTRTYTRMSDLPECVDFDLNVLGDSPVNKDIPLLRSNRAIIVTEVEEEEPVKVIYDCYNNNIRF